MQIDRQFCATKGFINYEGSILLLRESSNYEDGANAGMYDILGGRIKPGENPIGSLKREIKEETGLYIKVGEPFYIDDWKPQVKGEQWQIIGTTIECFAESNEVELSQDHDKYEWIDPKDYDDYELVDGLQRAFKYYLLK